MAGPQADQWRAGLVGYVDSCGMMQIHWQTVYGGPCQL